MTIGKTDIKRDILLTKEKNLALTLLRKKDFYTFVPS